MTPQFRLQRHQLADLRAIRDLGAELLSRAVSGLKALPPAPVRPVEIQSVLDRVIGEGNPSSEALLRQMLSLQGLARQLSLSSEDVFAGLRAGLQLADSGWGKGDFEKWLSIEDALRALFDLEVVRLSAKALDLSYAHSELLQHARILTDIRPVFNDEASEMRGTVVSHSLLLRYDDTQGNHMLSLALDEDDIRNLIRQCERALKKSETARRQLTKAEIPTIVPGKVET